MQCLTACTVSETLQVNVDALLINLRPQLVDQCLDFQPQSWHRKLAKATFLGNNTSAVVVQTPY